jgi:hypothetical protein
MSLEIHTVFTTADKCRGVACGFDSAGSPIRIWLKSNRAVKRALDQVERFANQHKMRTQCLPSKNRRLISATEERTLQ